MSSAVTRPPTGDWQTAWPGNHGRRGTAASCPRDQWRTWRPVVRETTSVNRGEKKESASRRFLLTPTSHPTHNVSVVSIYGGFNTSHYYCAHGSACILVARKGFENENEC